MLRITTSIDGESAAKYFDAALSRSDYYGSELGQWGGKAAERLGLHGEVSRDDFMSLASNKIPGKEEKLTVRTRLNRRAGYDFTFSVPKSVSIYLAENGDKSVERMIHEAYKETMADIEARMETRIRINGEQWLTRKTGNMAYASYVHRESRPVGGYPDPHYHIHGFAFNAVFDEVENRWKAGEFGNIKSDAPFYESAFNARLADKLVAHGYGIRRTERDFELASVSQKLIEKFSKRTKQIEAIAKRDHAIISARAQYLVKTTGMDFADAFALEKAELGARNRESKGACKLKPDELLAHWRAEMEPWERTSLQTEVVRATRSEGLLDVEAAKDLTLQHLFEQVSQCRELHVAGTLLRRGIGRVSVATARLFAKLDDRLLHSGEYVTTAKALAQEEETLRIAREGQGVYQPMGGVDNSIKPNGGYNVTSNGKQIDNINLKTAHGRQLSDEQAEAVRIGELSRELESEERSLSAGSKNSESNLTHGGNQPSNSGSLKSVTGLQLSAEQTEAVRVILSSRDLCTTLHGAAGVGKTSLMRTAIDEIENSLHGKETSLHDKEVIVLAPSSSAVEVLKKEGFSKSETFQRFQADELLQDIGRGQILWVDEAGFLSAKQMHWLVSYASQNGCRVIMSGDTKQHHSVDAGDALRVLEESGYCTTAMLTTIRRQQIEPLRNAVQDLSEGRTAQGFDKLDAYGAVHEHEDKAKRLEAIADLHLAARARGESCLIVAPTHEECRSIADAVRERIHKGMNGDTPDTQGIPDILNKDTQGIPNTPNMEININRLSKVNLTTAQKADAIFYQPGMIVQFDQRAKGGFKVGEQWMVDNQRTNSPLIPETVTVQLPADGKLKDRNSDLTVTDLPDNIRKVLPLDQAAAWSVYRPEEMPLASGDVVRVTKNFQSGGRKFRNNELLTVKTICNGIVIFDDSRSLPANGGKLHLDQGVAVTSHASQGKTVDNVIVSAPVDSFSQVNQAQFYVSMSRARKAMHIFTDCKAALREAVARPSERVSATELMREHAECAERPERKVSAVELMTKALKSVRMPAMPWMHAHRAELERQRVECTQQMMR